MAVVALVAGCPFAIPAPWLQILQFVNDGSENPGFLPSPLDNQSWFVVFGSAAVFLPVLLTSFKNRETLSFLTAPVLSAGIWFCALLFRAALTPGIQWSYLEVMVQVGFLLSFLAAVSISPATNQLYRLQLVLACSSIGISLLALLQHFGYNPLPYRGFLPGSLNVVQGKHAVASTFGHPNYMGSYLAPILTFSALSLLPRVWPWYIKAFGAVALVLGTLALIAGGTRGALLAFVVGTIAFGLLLSNNKSDLKKLLGRICLLVTGIVGLAAVASFILPGSTLLDRLFASKEVASRAFYWHHGIRSFMDAPTFGIGPGQFDRLFWSQILTMPDTAPGGPWHFVLTSIIRGVRPGYMHNDHLQVLVEMGVIGALIWVFLWSAIGLRIITLYRTVSHSADRIINAAAGGSFVAMFVDAFFGFPFHLPCSGLYFWVVLGFWCAWKPSVAVPPATAD